MPSKHREIKFSTHLGLVCRLRTARSSLVPPPRASSPMCDSRGPCCRRGWSTSSDTGGKLVADLYVEEKNEPLAVYVVRLFYVGASMKRTLQEQGFVHASNKLVGHPGNESTHLLQSASRRKSDLLEIFLAKFIAIAPVLN